MAPRDPPRNAAATITRKSGSNLWFVGRLLTPARRALFEAAYAGMRQIDDYVDDRFLSLPPADRARQRETACATVVAWRDACVHVLRGGSCPDALSDDLRAPVEALAAVPPAGRPPIEPWLALADAMLADSREDPMRSWDDFQAYCEGATVAPAAVFLHVLCAEEEQSGLSATLSAEDLFRHARPMAIFCYLVHIVRDIAKDVRATEQLLTVPTDLMALHGTDRGDLLAGGPGAVALLEDLLGRAADYRNAARDERRALRAHLGKREAIILDALLGIYDGLHDALKRDIPGALAGKPAPVDRIRRAIFGRMGIEPMEG